MSSSSKLTPANISEPIPNNKIPVHKKPQNFKDLPWENLSRKPMKINLW